jgi:hypothetical protein
MAKRGGSWKIGLLLLLAVGIYILLNGSPLGYGGQDAHSGVSLVSLDSIVSGGAQVTWIGVNGIDSQFLRPPTFTFQSNTATNGINIASASRGKVLQSQIKIIPKWISNCAFLNANAHCSDDPTYRIFDFDIVNLAGDIVWIKTSTPGSCNGYGCTWNTPVFTDQSNTFRLTVKGYSIGSNKVTVEDVSHTVNFEVINQNFFTSEDYYHNNIPSGVTVRYADCPLPDGYIGAHQAFHGGETISIGTIGNSQTTRTPVAFFCAEKPIDKYGAGILLGHDTASLQTIANGGSVVVPSLQVYDVWFVTQMSSYLQLLCPDAYVHPNSDGSCPQNGTLLVNGSCKVRPIYDSVSSNCTAYQGVVTFCNGVWVNGVCVDQALNLQILNCNMTGGYFDYATRTCKEYAPQSCSPACASDEFCNIDFYPPRCVKNFFREGICDNITIIETYPTYRVLTTEYSSSLDACVRPRSLKPLCNPSDGEYLGSLT